MLKIVNLSVDIENKNILHVFNLNINKGEIHAIMGPNGTGKSTLSKVIMGSKSYEVESGNIIFDGESINNLETDERARKGIFLSMQNPISIEGVQNSEFLKTALNARRDTPISLYEFIKVLDQKVKELDMNEDMIKRIISYCKKNKITIINITTDMDYVTFFPYLVVLYNKEIAMEGKTIECLKEEKLLRRLGFDLPFMIDLSIQLGYYGLLDRIITDNKEMIKEIWKS